MAEAFRILGQAAPAANTDVALITVPAGAGTHAVVSTLQVCNYGATQATFRISAAIAGAAITSPQYLYYDALVAPNSSVSLTIGITLDATDVLRVRSSTGSLSFNAFGTLVTP